MVIYGSTSAADITDADNLDKFRYICVESRRFNKTTLFWHSNRRELMAASRALVKALLIISNALLPFAKHLRLLTDNRSVRAFSKRGNEKQVELFATERLRSAPRESISQMKKLVSFSLEHVKGKMNILADLFSRPSYDLI